MIPDRDVWAAALLMVKRYGGDAMFELSQNGPIAAWPQMSWLWAPAINALQEWPEQI